MLLFTQPYMALPQLYLAILYWHYYSLHNYKTVALDPSALFTQPYMALPQLYLAIIFTGTTTVYTVTKQWHWTLLHSEFTSKDEL